MSTGDHMSVEQYRLAASKAMDEDTWQTIVVSQARARGWRVYHTFNSQRSTAGFPDLVLVRPPRVVFIELKRIGGRLTSAQLEWTGDLMQCHGVECHVWRPGDTYLDVLR